MGKDNFLGSFPLMERKVLDVNLTGTYEQLRLATHAHKSCDTVSQMSH
jgi:hypothetical protein